MSKRKHAFGEQVAAPAKLPYWGEGECMRCKRVAYYELRGKPMCGRHASKNQPGRRQLKRNPNAEQLKHEAYQNHLKTIEAAAKANTSQPTNGTVGKVDAVMMKMMKGVEQKPGWLMVFPNYKHQNRTDGYGCSALSPKSLPSIAGGAKNLENEHQRRKVFPFFAQTSKTSSAIAAQIRAIELEWRDAKDPVTVSADCGGRIDKLLAQLPEPLKEYKHLVTGMGQDTEPYRHQHDYLQSHSKAFPTIQLPKEKVNAPLYFIWADGKRYSYVQSRQFYCQIYERYAMETKEFKHLITECKRGVNLLICGYDAYPLDKHSLDWHYLDPAQPFGHEMVLLTLLTVSDPKLYPWNKFKTFTIF
jgi:hypothetical protein